MNILNVALIGGALWYYFKDTAEQMIDQVKFNIVEFGIDPKRTNIKGITFIARFKVINPTDRIINIKSIVGDVVIGRNELPFSMLTPIAIPGLSTKIIPVYIEISALSAGTLVATIYNKIVTGDSLRATIDGWINLDVGRFNFIEERQII